MTFAVGACPCGRRKAMCPEQHAERAAIALYAAMPSEPNHFRSGVAWFELSEATRRRYRARAMRVLAAASDDQQGRDADS